MRAEVARRLMAGSAWLLASHENPDGDAIGSLLGLGHLLRGAGRRALCVNVSGVPENYAFLPGAEEVLAAPPEGTRPADFDGLVILDSGDAERVGPLGERLQEFACVINIDHHLVGRVWGSPRWVDPGYAAVGEMVYELAGEMGAAITPEAAQCLYAALLTDTGSFRYSNTTSRALAAASVLVARGADPTTCARQIYLTHSLNRLGLLKRLLDSLELHLEGRVAVMHVREEDFQATGASKSDLEGFVDFARGVKGVELAALVRQEKDGHKFSIRSNGRVDSARLAAAHGGGGHRPAAGMFLKGSREEAMRIFLTEAAKLLAESGRAA